jgi:hypothetical protein
MKLPNLEGSIRRSFALYRNSCAIQDTVLHKERKVKTSDALKKARNMV